MPTSRWLAFASARPDMVLLDVSLKDADGLELLKEIKSFDANLHGSLHAFDAR